MNPIGRIIGAAYAARQALARGLFTGRNEPNESAAALARDGVVVLPGSADPELIRDIVRINAAYFDFPRPDDLLYSPDLIDVREVAGAPEEAVRRFYGLYIKNYHQKLDVYRSLVPLIAPIMSAYYGSHYYVRDSYCYRTQPIPEISGSYKWHTDNYPTGSSRCIVYLTDVDSVEDGPLAVALGSHAGYRPELGRLGARFEDRYVRENFKVRPCLGKKGTMVIFNNNSIHRATDPARGYREVVNFIMFPSIFRREGGPVRGLDLRTENTFLKKYTR